MNELITIFISMAFINNIVFVRYLGLCPYFGVSKKTGPALGMGLAVIFVMLIASAATWLINHYILIPFNVEFMNIVIFILVISSLVQIIELFIKRMSAALYNSLGIFLALITTNCAVLFVTMWNAKHDYTFIESIVAALASGIGFTLALILMSGIRERLEIADCPKSMKGLPIAFIAAMMLSLGLIGLGGMV